MHLLTIVGLFALHTAYWFFLPMLFGLLFLWVLLRQSYRQWRKLASADLEYIDALSGRKFEEYLMVLFDRLGYEVESTEYFDKGADLILEKDGVRTAVQVKSRRKDKVDVHAVRDVVASMQVYHCHRAMLVTNNYLTLGAKREASTHHVTYWNRDDLATIRLSLSSDDYSLPMPTLLTWFIPKGAVSFIRPLQMPQTAVCTICNKPVSGRVREFCLTQPERFEGKVYCYDHQPLVHTGQQRSLSA